MRYAADGEIIERTVRQDIRHRPRIHTPHIAEDEQDDAQNEYAKHTAFESSDGALPNFNGKPVRITSERQ